MTRRQRFVDAALDAAQVVGWAFVISAVPIYLVACWMMTTPGGPP